MINFIGLRPAFSSQHLECNPKAGVDLSHEFWRRAFVSFAFTKVCVCHVIVDLTVTPAPKKRGEMLFLVTFIGKVGIVGGL